MSADDLSLREILQGIWRGRWFVSGAVLVFVLFGFIFLVFHSPKYALSIDFDPNLYSVSSQVLCRGELACLEADSLKKLRMGVGKEWRVDTPNGLAGAKSYKLTTDVGQQIDLNKYRAIILSFNDKATAQLLEQAVEIVQLIQSAKLQNSISTEALSASMLASLTLKTEIERGAKSYFFGEPWVVRTSPGPFPIIGGAALAGMLIGVFIVLLRLSMEEFSDV